MWAIFAEAQYNENDVISGMCYAVVDGAEIKPGTWYMVKDGKFVEAGNESVQQL